MLKYLLLIQFLCISSIAAEEVVDSTEVQIVTDTTIIDSLEVVPPTIEPDTLTEAQKAYQFFLDRQENRKVTQKEKEIVELKTYLSFYDSLTTTLLHPRLNNYSAIKKSFSKDAGDYFRTDPSYFVQDYQQTPLRKTVRPFGLSGNRMNVIVNGLSYTPFEHIPEPDGLVDFNDIPTGLTREIYILPGGVGQLFGGDQSVATLVTVPNQPDSSFEPEIRLHVDKGSFNYAYTRGGYTKLFSNGKELDLSVDYRNSSGIRTATNDNSYHYTGRTVIPMNSSYYLFASGSTYSRKGAYRILKPSVSSSVTRSRTDRNGQIAIEKISDDEKVKYHLGYNYLKQNSNIDGDYKGRFNFYGNELQFVREAQLSNKMLKTEISFSHLKQSDGIDDDSEKNLKASSTLLKKNSNGSFGLTAGAIYNDEYNFLPFTSVVYQRYSDNNFMMLSLAYSEKAPSMHDTNLKLQIDSMYAGVSSTLTNSITYADIGNKWLLSEKQLVGTFLYEYGSMKNNLRFTLTGGQLFDGIDWYHTETLIGAELVNQFKPENSNITFADLQLKQKYSYNDFLNVSIGGAYHFIEYELVDSRPYQPEYQIFGAGELHHYWKQKWIDLNLYGEIVYSGPYQGYFDEPLGENIVINSGMSFKLKRFHFYYIFQNSINVYRPNPDSFNELGRYQYYGFTWDFLN